MMTRRAPPEQRRLASGPVIAVCSPNHMHHMMPSRDMRCRTPPLATVLAAALTVGRAAATFTFGDVTRNLAKSGSQSSPHTSSSSVSTVSASVKCGADTYASSYRGHTHDYITAGACRQSLCTPLCCMHARLHMTYDSDSHPLSKAVLDSAESQKLSVSISACISARV